MEEMDDSQKENSQLAQAYRFRDDRWKYGGYKVGWGRGYLAALRGDEVRLLVKALEDVGACTPDTNGKAIAQKAIAAFRVNQK